MVNSLLLKMKIPVLELFYAKRKKTLIEISLPKNTNIHASKYQLYLPSKEELKEQMKKIDEELELY